MKNKFKIKTLLISGLATTAVVAPVLASCSKHDKEPEIESKYFEIVNGVLKGFKPGLTEEQKKEACKDGKLILPPVKVIDSNAFAADMFRDAPFAGEIIIDAATETIGQRAFFNNTAEKITWNDGVAASQCTHIGKSAFAFCKNLKQFEMPSGLLKTSSTDLIEDGAFFSCSSLSVIDLSLGSTDEINVPKWSSGAFRGIPKEGNVIFGSSEPEQEDVKVRLGCLWSRLVFAGVHPEQWPQSYRTNEGKIVEWKTPIKVAPEEYLTKTDGVITGYNHRMWKQKEFDTLIVTDIGSPGVTSILPMADTGLVDKDLKYISLYRTQMTKIPDNFCKDYQGATNIPFIWWPSTITEIGKSAFQDANITTKFEGLDKVVKIGESAFQDFNNLTEFKFANSNVELGEYAFKNAKKLANLDFTVFGTTKPGWTTTDAFEGTGSDTGKVNVIDIDVQGVTNPVDIWRLRHNLQGVFENNQMALAPEGKKNHWKFNPPGYFDNINQLLDIDELGTLHGWAKDSNGTPMTPSEVSDALTELKFDGTWMLPDNVVEIAAGAFWNKDEGSLIPTDKITRIDFKKVVKIGANAFRGSDIEVAAFWETVRDIGASAFQDCLYLHNIRIGKVDYETLSQYKVGKNAFLNAGKEYSAEPGSESVWAITNFHYTNEFDQWQLNHLIKTTFKNIKFGDGTTWEQWKFDHADNATLVTMDKDGVVTGLVTADKTPAVTEDSLVALAKEKYPKDTYLHDINFVIPKQATSIAASAFIDVEAQKSTIPLKFEHIAFESGSQCTSIGEYAFFHVGVADKKTISLDFLNATQLTTIGDHAFGLSNITGKIQIPASIKSIGEGAFYENKITELYIPKLTGTILDPVVFANGCFAGNELLATIDMREWDEVPGAGISFDETILDSIATQGTIIVQTEALKTDIKDFLAECSYTINEYYDNWNATIPQ